MNDPATKVRVLYSVPEAMALLNLGRTQIYELIRTSRLVTVTQGRRRLVPADSITDYVQLLLTESQSVAMGTRHSNREGGRSWNEARQCSVEVDTRRAQLWVKRARDRGFP
jgi:excisionase family DNA binding protein